MKISAHLENSRTGHSVKVETNGAEKTLAIPARDDSPGSGVNGGELLCLALATCYCNDIYREGARRGIDVHRVEVHVNAEFGGEGEPARGITYSVKIEADASDDDVRELISHTDTVAEIQNTLRNATNVSLSYK